MVPVLTVERGVIGVAGFILLLLLESVRPFRRPVDARWRRYAINLFITGSNAFLLSVLLGSLIVSVYHTFELHRFGLLYRLGLDGWGNVLVTVVGLDAVTYAWHRAYHGLPFLWRLHRVHHSDRDLDVTTSGRFHLTEMVLSAIFRLGVIAFLGASVASVVIFEIAFGVLNQLEHANLRIPEPWETWLRWVIVTPDMHRLHHSQRTEHTNSNYSTIFSWWDRLCRTYRFGDDQAALVIGLPEYQRRDAVTFGNVLAMPFGPPCVVSRRWRVGVVVVAMGFVGILVHGMALAARAIGQSRAVAVRYVARLPQLPADAQEVRVWIPLAKTSAEQVVEKRTVTAPVSYTIGQEPVYGNDVLYIALAPPFLASLEIAIDYQATLRAGGSWHPGEPAPTSAQLARTTAPEGLVVIDDAVRSRAQQATAGRATPPEQARAIYDQVIARMAYDKAVPGWGRGDTKRACRLGKGNCTDFHSLFMSMARAERIPSRFKIGVVVPDEPSGTIAGYHCWAEFYEASRGWVSVDASEAWKHPERAAYYFGSWDANRFLISTGRSLDLVPKQQGEPINMFLYPYVEVNGQPWTGITTEVRFQNLKQEGTT